MCLCVYLQLIVQVLLCLISRSCNLWHAKGMSFACQNEGGIPSQAKEKKRIKNNRYLNLAATQHTFTYAKQRRQPKRYNGCKEGTTTTSAMTTNSSINFHSNCPQYCCYSHTTHLMSGVHQCYQAAVAVVAAIHLSSCKIF